MGVLIKLVKAYQRMHDPAVGDSIVRAISSDLRLFLMGHAPKESVDDLLQETLIGIFLGIQQFKGKTDAQFYGYCYVIARRRVIDLWRRRGREPEFVFPEKEVWEAMMQPEPRLSKEERERLAAVMALLAAVRPPCLPYLVAHYIVGMTFGQMAKVFGFSSKDAARMATARCLRLAKELGEE